MARWCFDDGLGSVLSADMPSKVFAGVALIGHHEVGMELGGCVSGLHQHTGCPTDVMDVGRGDYHCEGEFVFAVNGQMSLVAQPEFLQVARSIFYGPGSIFVCSRLLAPLRPCLDIRGVYGYPFPEPSQDSETFSDHLLHDLLDEPAVFPFGEFRHEAGIGGLAWDVFRGVYAAGVGDERVVFQEPYEGGNGGQTEGVADKITAPEYPSLPRRLGPVRALSSSSSGSALKIASSSETIRGD